MKALPDAHAGETALVSVLTGHDVEEKKYEAEILFFISIKQRCAVNVEKLIKEFETILDSAGIVFKKGSIKKDVNRSSEFMDLSGEMHFRCSDRASPANCWYALAPYCRRMFGNTARLTTSNGNCVYGQNL
jgi:hypothetical protein